MNPVHQRAIQRPYLSQAILALTELKLDIPPHADPQMSIHVTGLRNDGWMSAENCATWASGVWDNTPSYLATAGGLIFETCS